MMWILAIVLFVFIVVPRVLRRRRAVVAVFPSQPISTMNSAMSKKTKKETKAALDAATSLLQ